MVANGGLYTRVMEKLNFEPSLDASNLAISIQGDHDVVLIEGTVNSFAEKWIAVNAIKSIQGIKAVADEIKVDPSQKYKRSDVNIAEAATTAIESNVFVPADKIKLVVKEGIITLSGEVEWQYQKIRAETALRNLWGVKSIINI